MICRSKIVSLILFLSLFVAGGCKSTWQATSHTSKTQTVSGAADSGMSAFLEPYRVSLTEKMDEHIGLADTTLTKMQPESTLGNFMADAQLQAARRINPAVNISVANYGGIRISYLTKGDIKLRNMYELMPFDNMLTIIEVPGNLLRRLCDHMAALGGWPVSGMSYIIKDKKAINILVDGKQLNEQAMYKVAISDYVANGGDKCDFLKTATHHNTNVLIRDALISYVRDLTAQNRPLHSSLENRVQHAQ